MEAVLNLAVAAAPVAATARAGRTVLKRMSISRKYYCE
jgi:hypothetical protein